MAGRVARSALFVAVARALGLLAGLIVSPWIIGVIGREGFAAWAFGLAVAYHLNILSEFGSGIALVYGVSQGRSRPREAQVAALSEALGSHFFLALGSVPLKLGLAALARWWFSAASLPDELLLAALVLAILRPVLMAYEVILQGCERFDGLAWISLLRVVAWMLWVWQALRMGYGAPSLLWGESAIMLLLALPGLWLARAALPAGVRVRWPGRRALMGHWRYGLGILASLLADMLNSQSDKLLIGEASGSLRAYELGQKLASPGRTALQMLGQVLFPSAPGLLLRAGPEGLARIERLAQKVTALGAAWLFSLIFVAAPSILLAWLGAELVDDELVSATRMLALSAGIAALFEVPLQLARGLGKLGPELRGLGVCSVLGFGLRIILWRQAGLQGLLLGSCLSSLAMMLWLRVAYAPVFSYQCLPHLLETALAPALAGVLSALLIAGWTPFAVLGRVDALLALSLQGALYTLSFGLASWWVLGREDRERLWDALTRRAGPEREEEASWEAS